MKQEQNVIKKLKGHVGRLRRGGSAWVLPASVLAAAIWPVNPAIAGFALLGVLLVPGIAVMAPLGVRPGHPAARVSVAVALGSVMLMLNGFASSLIGPAIGVDRPLDRGAQLWLIALELVVSAVVLQRSKTGVQSFLADGSSGRWAVVLCVLPILSLLGAVRLNAGSGAGLAQMALFISVGVLAAAVIASFRYDSVPGAAVLYSTVLSVVWATAARGSHLYGWDIQQEFGVALDALTRGSWSSPSKPDPYQAMLSITSFPSQLSAISGIELESVFRYVFPAMLAAVPVLVYLGLKRVVQTSTALFVSGTLVAASLALARQMPAIGRQEVALFLFAAAVLVITDLDLARRGRQVVAGALLCGLSFTHYTTAYTTAFMFLAAAVVGAVVQRRTQTGERIITTPFAGIVMATTLLWNLVITHNGVVLDRPAGRVATRGLELLPRGSRSSLLTAWLQGSGARLTPVAEYAPLLEDQLGDSLHWMQPDAALRSARLSDVPVQLAHGALQDFSRLWNALQVGSAQLVVALISASVLWMLWALRKKTASVSGDIIGMAVAAGLLSLVLRVSGTASQMYNPERGALHTAIILAIPVALLIEHVREQRLVRPAMRALGQVALVAVFSVSLVKTWGVGAYLFEGSPPAATSEFGEDLERFAVSDAELATARHLADRLPATSLVQTDRYGALVMLDVDAYAEFGLVSVLHPSAIDERAYVYLSRTNTVHGRARGQLNQMAFRFNVPTDALERSRAIVYSTEETRVYR